MVTRKHVRENTGLDAKTAFWGVSGERPLGTMSLEWSDAGSAGPPPLGIPSSESPGGCRDSVCAPVPGKGGHVGYPQELSARPRLRRNRHPQAPQGRVLSGPDEQLHTY